ncbi:GH92 family glycosyl hydrolase [Sporolactobacillus terrae]|nr:GH92 family glycosyl hydrolase [Sporolactobacillus terrae]
MGLHLRNKIMLSCICLVLTISLVPVPVEIVKAETNQDLFSTSFEKKDSQPSWTSSSEHSEDQDRPMTNGIKPLDGHGRTMTTSVTRGPSSLYNAASKAGWSGNRVLTYSGQSDPDKKTSDACNKLFQVNLPVAKHTQLSYMVAPQPTKKDVNAQAAAYVSIDLAFSDGTYLHQLDIKDQDGIRMTPADQGKSGTLLMNQWNQKTIDLGKAAKGKTIVRILIAYQAPKAGITFQGAIDDLRIGPQQTSGAAKSPVDQVNILRGTASSRAFPRGNTAPAVGVPNGFVYWSPAINSSAKEQLYPYNQNNDPENLPEIQSFSLSRSANDQSGSHQTFQVMPSSFIGTPSASRIGRGKAFKRTDESAHPYRYSVTFTDGMRAQMAATSHASIMRYTFPGTQGNLIFDNLDKHGSLTLHPESQSLEGYSDIKDSATGNMNRMFFYAELDRPIIYSGKLSGEKRDQSTAFYKFDTSKDKSVTMKIGTSLISRDQAKKNLNQEIDKRSSLKSVANKAKHLWNKRLAKVTVNGANQDQLTSLYSNLYRMYLSPNDGSENVGSIKKPNYRYADLSVPAKSENTTTNTGAPIKKGKVYVNSDFAYSAQTVWPAYTLLEPKLTGTFINGFLKVYKNGGTLRADAGPAFADAVLKGAKGVDTELLYQAMLYQASAAQEGHAQTFIGYSPSSQKDSVGKTLTQAESDAVLGNLAAYLANKHPNVSSYADDRDYYLSRAQNYLHLFNQSLMNFAPKSENEDTKANAAAKNSKKTSENWFHTFQVPQDGQGLANLFGGKIALSKTLDQFFTTAPSDPAIKSSAADRLSKSGQLGMFTLDHPFSPSTAYMYLFAGTPWETQRITRFMLRHFYTGSAIGGGYLGTDSGAMLSGYYLFGAAGFYPLQKGSANYVIGAPYFKQMILHLDNGNDLIINAPKVSNKNQYIQSATLNGRPIAASSLSAADLQAGGTLSFEMGAQPSSWGTAAHALPHALTPQSTNGSSFYPQPLDDLSQKAVVRASEGTDNLEALTDNNAETNATFDRERPSASFHFKTESPRIKQYTLTSSGARNSSDPKTWTLWASDDGIHWGQIDRRTNQTFAWRSMTRSYTIKNPKAYAYYKVTVDQKSSTHPLALSEFQLLGYSGITKGFTSLKRELEHQYELKNVTEAERDHLIRILDQAQSAYKDGNLSASISSMQAAVQQMNALLYQTNASEKSSGLLLADAHAIVNLLSD